MSERTLTIKGSSPYYEGTVTAHFAGKITGWNSMPLMCMIRR